MLTVGLLPSVLKVAFYRMQGARIGNNVSIGPLSVLVAEKLEIGDGTRIGFATILRGREITLKRHVKIGSMTFFDVERIFIDDDAKINEQVFAGGPMLPESYLHIGKNTIVMQYTFLNATKPLVIGDGTGIGGHCLLFTHGSWQSVIDGYPVTFAPITLGKNVWLPWRVFIMPGVTVGDGATIGANSLVTKDVPASSLAAGSPAKVLRGPDQYPQRLTDDQKRDHIKAILAEFAGYLSYHGIGVAREETPTGIRIHTTSSKRQELFVALQPVSATEVRFTEAEACAVALFGFTSPPVAGGQVLWADCARQSRIGSSDIGEETLLFLSRYGMRFYRAD